LQTLVWSVNFFDLFQRDAYQVFLSKGTMVNVFWEILLERFQESGIVLCSVDFFSPKQLEFTLLPCSVEKSYFE